MTLFTWHDMNNLTWQCIKQHDKTPSVFLSEKLLTPEEEYRIKLDMTRHAMDMNHLTWHVPLTWHESPDMTWHDAVGLPFRGAFGGETRRGISNEAGRSLAGRSCSSLPQRRRRENPKWSVIVRLTVFLSVYLSVCVYVWQWEPSRYMGGQEVMKFHCEICKFWTKTKNQNQNKTKTKTTDDKPCTKISGILSFRWGLSYTALIYSFQIWKLAFSCLHIIQEFAIFHQYFIYTWDVKFV